MQGFFKEKFQKGTQTMRFGNKKNIA